MTWYRYGKTPSDWTFVTAVDGVTPNFAPGAVLTAWNQETGGTSVQYSLDNSGSTLVSSITSSDGSDGLPPGTVDEHFTQTLTYWVDGNGGAGPRLYMETTDAADIAGLAAANISDLQDAVTAIQAVTDLVSVYNIEVAGAWPPRPLVAAGRVVTWIGPDVPTAGGTGMADGDVWFRTAS